MKIIVSYLQQLVSQYHLEENSIGNLCCRIFSLACRVHLGIIEEKIDHVQGGKFSRELLLLLSLGRFKMG